MKLKTYKFVTTKSNIKYYRNCVTHALPVKTDLIKCLNNIKHTGARYVPITVQEQLEVLVFISTEDEVKKLKQQHLPLFIDVVELPQK